MTSNAGTSANNMTRAVVSRSRSRRSRSTTKADRARIKSSLPSSAGWNEKKGRLSARLEPRAAVPRASTTRISPSIAA